MSLSEKELDQMIKNQVANELASNIEVPNIDDQWQKIKNRITENDSSTKEIPFTIRKRLVFAAAIVISIGSMTFLNPNNATAVGGRIYEFFNAIVGKTTQNKIESYRQANNPGVPNGVPVVEEIAENIEKEVTLDIAQATVPFKLATPRYLPEGAAIRKVILTDMGADVYEVSIEYKLDNRLFILRQQNSANETSRGTLYDTDDTVTKDLTVNGSPAILFLTKGGISTLNWQSRGLLLQIVGKITEEEITKVAQSIN